MNVINDQVVKILGVSTYRWTPHGQKLGVLRHRGHHGLMPMSALHVF